IEDVFGELVAGRDPAGAEVAQQNVETDEERHGKQQHAREHEHAVEQPTVEGGGLQHASSLPREAREGGRHPDRRFAPSGRKLRWPGGGKQDLMRSASIVLNNIDVRDTDLIVFRGVPPPGALRAPPSPASRGRDYRVLLREELLEYRSML